MLSVKHVWKSNLLKDKDFDLRMGQHWMLVATEIGKDFDIFFRYKWVWKPEKNNDSTVPRVDMGYPKDQVDFEKAIKEGAFSHITDKTEVSDVIKILTAGESADLDSFLKTRDEVIKVMIKAHRTMNLCIPIPLDTTFNRVDLISNWI